MEAHKDQVVIRVVPGVPDRHVPEEAAIHPQDVVHTGTHPPPQTDHDSRPSVASPGALVRKEVIQLVLQSLRFQSHHDLLIPL